VTVTLAAVRSVDGKGGGVGSAVDDGGAGVAPAGERVAALAPADGAAFDGRREVDGDAMGVAAGLGGGDAVDVKVGLGVAAALGDTEGDAPLERLAV